jgi:competence protein ComEA
VPEAETVPEEETVPEAETVPEERFRGGEWFRPEGRAGPDERLFGGEQVLRGERHVADAGAYAEDETGAQRVAAWGLRRGHLVVVAVLLLVAVVGVGVMVIRDRPVRESVTQRPVATASVVASSRSEATTASASPTPTSLVIHVAGKVRKPGVIQLPPGSRVIDAVSASGGTLHGVDLAALNLARPLVDGEQVLVGVTAPPGAPVQGAAPGLGGSAGGSATTGQPGVPVNLNTASLEELETLPGVGPVLAQRIVEFRMSQGSFARVEDLQNVTGIGEQKYADLRDRVTV